MMTATNHGGVVPLPEKAPEPERTTIGYCDRCQKQTVHSVHEVSGDYEDYRYRCRSCGTITYSEGADA